MKLDIWVPPFLATRELAECSRHRWKLFALILEEYRGRRHLFHSAIYNEDMILEWADEYCKHTGEWPSSTSGPVGNPSCNLTWRMVDYKLRNPKRGCSCAMSLARLLAKQRGYRLILPPRGAGEEPGLSLSNGYPKGDEGRICKSSPF